MINLLNLCKGTFYRIFAGVIAALISLTGFVDFCFRGDVYMFESCDTVVGLETLERAQGVTTDGKGWIFSGKSTLVKIGFDNETILAANYKAIPKELKEKFGSNHIGGISYANGFVYAAIEDQKAFQHPLIVIFDADTLSYTGKYYELDITEQIRGVPWIACDVEKGLIYAAKCKRPEYLLCYDINTGERVNKVKLSQTIEDIQGGEMYKGDLYVATSDDTRAVYKVNVENGTVEKYFDRIMVNSDKIDNFGGEGEDMTVLEMEDGTVFHTLELGALFINANLKHYKVK